MMLIEELLQELTDISTDFNTDNDMEIRNLKLDLLIQRVESIELNMKDNPLEAADKKAKTTLNHLLLRYKLKAIISLKSLKEKDKRSYNKIARNIISKKLFFTSLHTTITRSTRGYMDRNKLHHVQQQFQIFIEGDAAINE